ncbi:tRNA-uridine aminocarboxypropyltransferase [Ferrimonas balearica]|uniref:tRNA-uridine aminocarboxypropyltransferase n=1 Tax=Ferrimonas balearica TaxID=44012 RepID=UPI001F21807C|nr:tRNA-uridine aminocarboxypropyltransferase [Ferrimonas balearica]MBY6019180.1 DTW domain-containing protein [Halomonas denitrificans]MBY6095783.1 DTW domain-containing protein [Ferrimonas balearica]
MSRATCPRCQRPQRTCLCHAIKATDHRLPVHILMHPSELKCAKGTAGLTAAVLNQCQLWCGESEADFAPLRAALGQCPSFLLYPAEDAQPVESVSLPADAQLLLIDGTWRKTHKMLQLNPWLAALPTLTFRDAPSGDYRIRKAHRADSLSTLEATAYALQCLEGLDPAPLLTAFDALKQSQLAHMPESVRQRYHRD